MKVCKVIALLLVFLALCGCTNFGFPYNNSQYTGRSDEEPTIAVGSGYIKLWQLLEGEVNLSHMGELSIVEINESQEGIYTIGVNQYMAFSDPEGKHELSATSGWRIALAELSVLGLTKDGTYIFGSGQENSPILCLYNADTDQKQCLMQIDLIEKGVSFFTIGEFEFYLDGEPVQEMEQAVSLYRIHTGDNYEATAWPILCEDEVRHSLVMVLRDCPAIKYEINVSVCGSKLYLENINNQSHVVVPTNQIFGDN